VPRATLYSLLTYFVACDSTRVMSKTMPLTPGHLANRGSHLTMDIQLNSHGKCLWVLITRKACCCKETVQCHCCSFRF